MDEETIAQQEENVTPTESQTDTKQEEETHANEGDNTRSEKDIPFHQHPRWKEREEEWQKRYNEQDQRFQDMLSKIIQNKEQEQPKTVEIPAWFVGGEEEWKDYTKRQDEIEARAEERAFKRIQAEKEKEQQAKMQEETLVKEATQYLEKSVEEIKNDSRLNPTGEEIDVNKLVKYALDNYILDEQGKWDYKKAYKYMKLEEPHEKPNANRKTVAGATTSGNKGEDKERNYKTSEDFKRNRPW